MAVHSCVVLAARCEGKEIATVEGLSQDGELNELQREFLKHGAPAMRLLHPRNVDGCNRAFTAESATELGRNQDRARRQPLPLHGLHGNIRRDSGLRPG